MLKKLIVYWLPVFLWMSLIFFLSSFHKLQSDLPGWQDYVLRKIAHFFEYTVLCFLFFRGFRQTTNVTLVKALIFSVFLTITYAASDELHQTFVSGRSGKPFDVMIDGLGAFFGLLFSWKIINILPEKVKKIIV